MYACRANLNRKKQLFGSKLYHHQLNVRLITISTNLIP